MARKKLTLATCEYFAAMLSAAGLLGVLAALIERGYALAAAATFLLMVGALCWFFRAWDKVQASVAQLREHHYG